MWHLVKYYYDYPKAQGKGDIILTSFNKGEYVKYATSGVCLIENITKIDYLHDRNPQEFYVLKPIAANSSTVYVPLANNELTSKMRKLLSKEEIDSLIDASKSDAIEWINDRKARSEKFKSIISKSEPDQLLKLVGCIYVKKQELLKNGKKLSSTDASLLSSAEELIKNEFSFVLQMSGTQIGAYIRDRLEIE